MELEECTAKAEIKTIPAGKYFCTQSEKISIENTPVIFADHVKNMTSYLAIETVFSASKYEVGKPISELRIIGLP